ncbi:MAG: STAS domain-containing protein [Bacilli bacterium]|nr:STAS domain-containing protein [Bacilli bacterium]
MKYEYNKGILFVRLKGDLDRSISKEINTKLIPTILSQKIKYVVFNLYEVNSINDFGTDALLNAKCAVKSVGGKVCICDISDKIKYNVKKLHFNSYKDELSVVNLIEVN